MLALYRLPGHVVLGSISPNLVFHYALLRLRTLSQIVDDQVESGFRDDIDQRRQHLQGPLATTKHHLQQHMGQTCQCVKSGTAVTQCHARRLQDRGRAYQVVTDKLLSKLKRAGGDVNQVLQLGLRTRDWTNASNHSSIHLVGGVSDKLHGGEMHPLLKL